MRPYEFPDFETAIKQAQYQLKYRSSLVHSAKWQGSDISNRPEMATHECTHISFGVDLHGDWELERWRQDIRPNLPWADNHFMERVCGEPINPGVEWANWPYNRSAATFLVDGQFNHNYMERYWPKNAGLLAVPTTDAKDFKVVCDDIWTEDILPTRKGIRYKYGDLMDVVRLMAGDSYTRQAYLPVWFPEDTGGGDKRAPCTIGYHFLMRDGRLDINYHIRSCDFIRHFRDDMYLTVRLLLWMIEECEKLDDRWKDVVPGKFFMQIGSLHVFRNDFQILQQMKD